MSRRRTPKGFTIWSPDREVHITPEREVIREKAYPSEIRRVKCGGGYRVVRKLIGKD